MPGGVNTLLCQHSGSGFTVHIFGSANKGGGMTRDEDKENKYNILQCTKHIEELYIVLEAC